MGQSVSSTSSSSTTSPSTTTEGSTSTASTVSTSSSVSSSSSSVGTSTGTSETPQTSESTVTSSESSQGSTEVGTTSVTTTTDRAASDTTTTTGETTTDSTPLSSTVAVSPGSTPTSTATPTTSLSTVTSTSSPATSHEVSTTPTSFVSDLAGTIASTLSTILSTVTSTGTTLTTPLGSSTSGPTSTTSGQTAGSSTQATGATGSSSTTPATTTSTGPTTDTAYTGPTADADGVVFRNTTVNLLPNCTQITVETLFFANGTTLRNTTVEFNACSSTSPLTTAPTTPEATTTYNWPTGGTTRTLPSGEIIISESLIAYKNCTTVLMQLIYNPSTNTSRTAITSDPEGCKTTTTNAPVTSTDTPTAQTTTFNWPTGGTTRTLPSGDIILSESLIAYKNCTTVLMQLIFTPSTNQTRTETTTDAEGCKASSTTTPGPSTTASSTAKTTTYNWPTGGTTRVLPSGEIIISESLIAYQNCTTVLMQLIFTPFTNQTRTETTTDLYGCKSSSSSTASSTASKITTPMPSSTPAASTTTTFPWPTGGTTRTLPSGEVILSESLTAYKNCTTVLMQLLFNPTTNTTRTETTSDAQGCKATSSSSPILSSSQPPTTPMPTTTPGKATTTFPWPTGGTTRTMPSGEIIISESLTAYKNCTTVLMQLIYNPKTNTTRTETTSDAEGCKTTPTTTRAPTTTTFNWPTGGTTRVLPSGEIIISESLTAYKNCTTVLMQLLFNPATNTTRTETTSDAQGCKATSIKAATSTPSTTTRTPSTSTAPPTQTTTYSWPTGGTTRLLPSGEIILSESLTAYPNCTTTLRQLILNPTTNTTRTETVSDAQGCKATTSTKAMTPAPSAPGSSTTPPPATTAPTHCPALKLDMSNTIRPTFNEVKGSYAIGERVVHMCKKRYAFEYAGQPLKIYQCMPTGKWAGEPEKCISANPSSKLLPFVSWNNFIFRVNLPYLFFSFLQNEVIPLLSNPSSLVFLVFPLFKCLNSFLLNP
ncbi:hypothetical protein CAEBREN_02457 [Caenorhabditis brenneri]|uniref:Sushi domain-containing protein n=1 Tax=Caenorhabditis brenneri TaxID=135651 RepID=G0NNY2_CAEBE|nr:hypothetical protein CAEBREN_02457 [Caenorhabditis brenneri]